MIDIKPLRLGNWIYCKGSSHYGIVTGEILAKMERDEKFREKFEYIELTGELLEAAGFEFGGYAFPDGSKGERWINGFYLVSRFYTGEGFGIEWIIGGSHSSSGVQIIHLHHFQNIIFDLTLKELPLPESAKIIPKTINS